MKPFRMSCCARSSVQGEKCDRVVPLSDPAYVDEMSRLLASTRDQFEDDPITGELRALPVWYISDRTVRNWLVRATDAAERDRVKLSISPPYVPP